VQFISRGELRAPAIVLDLDSTADADADPIDVTPYQTAWCLVRHDDVPQAICFVDLQDVTSVRPKEIYDYAPVATELGPPAADAQWAGTITVVICTRSRPDGLRSTLRSLVGQSCPDFDVLVVDNSADGDCGQLVQEFTGLDVRWVHEPKPGLSRARNRALTEVRAEVVAWLDDDEVADPSWLSWVRRGFGSPERPDAISGVMLPAELATAAQVDFERYGGFNKGRGVEPTVLRKNTPTVFDPLYPLPNFGAGGNMAFRTELLRRIGGFDNRLGAGTLTCGGEETLAYSLLLDQGATVLYWPPAVTWHYHRKTDADLEKQFYGYAAGLTAFYMSLLISSPRYLLRIAGFVPRGARRLLSHTGTGDPDTAPADFPVALLRAGRRGLLHGAWLYLREVIRQRGS
jgi:glycosyltransferase involved in cell wall biosynthesis